MKRNLIIKYGTILSIICILYFISTNILGYSGTQLAGWLSYLPYLIVIIYGIRKHISDFSSYKSKFLFGLSITLIAAVVSSVFMYFFLLVVSDAMIVAVIESEVAMLDKNAPDYLTRIEQIKNGITPFSYLIFGTVVGAIMGLIMSLIAPLFVRAKKRSV